MAYLRDIFRKYLSDATVLFTVGRLLNNAADRNIINMLVLMSLDGDGLDYLKCGTVQGAYATVDFGPGANVNQSFNVQRQYAPRGPLVNTEFYPGWLDLWGHAHSTVSTEEIINTLEQMLSLYANVNFYMFFGGTNFGFTSGALRTDILTTNDLVLCVQVQIRIIHRNQRRMITMHRFLKRVDFVHLQQLISRDRHLGDITSKYLAIRQVIGKYFLLPSTPIPTNNTKKAYGTIQLSLVSWSEP
jgi:beta-galactosidase